MLSPGWGLPALVHAGCEDGLSITLAKVTPEGNMLNKS